MNLFKKNTIVKQQLFIKMCKWCQKLWISERIDAKLNKR